MKLLLVEDDMEISRMLREYLTTENYEVACAADGKEACEKFDHDSYSLVLLDLIIHKCLILVSLIFAVFSVYHVETKDLM